MNNQPQIEAYKSFYQYAKNYYAAGGAPVMREAFLFETEENVKKYQRFMIFASAFSNPAHSEWIEKS